MQWDDLGSPFLARRMFESMMNQYIRPEDGQTLRDYQRVVLGPRDRAKAQPAPRPTPPREHLAEAVAATRSPEGQAELQQALAEARAYRGQGKRS